MLLVDVSPVLIALGALALAWVLERRRARRDAYHDRLWRNWYET